MYIAIEKSGLLQQLVFGDAGLAPNEYFKV